MSKVDNIENLRYSFIWGANKTSHATNWESDFVITTFIFIAVSLNDVQR